MDELPDAQTRSRSHDPSQEGSGQADLALHLKHRASMAVINDSVLATTRPHSHDLPWSRDNQRDNLQAIIDTQEPITLR